MKKTVLTIVLGITLQWLNAQTDDVRSLLQMANDLKFEAYLHEANIEGSPYAKEEKVMGTFYQTNHSITKSPTRLNYFLNGFEFVSDGKTYVVAANSIDSVSVNNETYVYRTFGLSGTTSQRLVKIIDRKGACTLFVYQKVNFVPAVKAAGYIDPKPAKFEWNDPVYILETGNKLIVLTSFKELTKAFPDKEPELKKFIKDNAIKKDKPEGLKKLLEFVSRF